MINSLKKYMFVDLLVLAVIGFVLELLCVRFGGSILNASPTATISLLIVLIAVTRWNWWGLLICPIMALATLLGGRLIEINYLQAVYDYKIYISAMLGYLIYIINIIFYKKFTTAKTINSSAYIGILLLDYVGFCLVQIGIYYLFCTVTKDNMLFEYIDIENKLQVANLQRFGQSGLIYNLIGLAIIIVGGFALRSQGIICNMKQKFIDDRENAELMAKDRNFRIDDVENSQVGDDVSQKNDDENHQNVL